MLYKPKFLSPSATGDTKYLEKKTDGNYEFSCVCDGNTKVTGGELIILNQPISYLIDSNNYSYTFKIKTLPYSTYLTTYFSQLENSIEWTWASGSSAKIYFNDYVAAKEPNYTYKISIIASSSIAGNVNNNNYWYDINNGTEIPLTGDVDVDFALNSENNKYYISKITLKNCSSDNQYTLRNQGTITYNCVYIKGFKLKIYENDLKYSLYTENNEGQYPVNNKGEYNRFIWNVPVQTFNSLYENTEAQWQVTLTDGKQTVQSGIEVARLAQHPQLEIEVID